MIHSIAKAFNEEGSDTIILPQEIKYGYVKRLDTNKYKF